MPMAVQKVLSLKAPALEGMFLPIGEVHWSAFGTSQTIGVRQERSAAGVGPDLRKTAAHMTLTRAAVPRDVAGKRRTSRHAPLCCARGKP